MGAQTDVLVVGAGPAGSVTALLLARAGVRVRLLDRATFPRDKLCGDTVNPGSLALLDQLGIGAAVRAAALAVSGMTVTGPGGASVTADYPRGLTGAALTRRHLDQMLVEAAIAAGVVFDDGVSVRTLVISGAERVDGVMARWGGPDCAVPARVVVAADGRASRLGSALGLTSFAARPRRWAFGAYFEGVEGLTRRGEMHVRKTGYLGIAPLPGGIANVCVVRELSGDSRGTSLVRLAGADLPRSAPRDLHERVLHHAIDADPALRERFATAKRISDLAVLGPLAVEARSSGCPGLLLAGDAAGFVDPMTGDGLRFALRGGMLAAEYALRELECGRAQHSSLHAARRHEFSAKWRLNRALRALVASPLGVGLAAGVAMHWNAPIRSLIGMAGDVRLAVGSPEWVPPRPSTGSRVA